MPELATVRTEMPEKPTDHRTNRSQGEFTYRWQDPQPDSFRDTSMASRDSLTSQKAPDPLQAAKELVSSERHRTLREGLTEYEQDVLFAVAAQREAALGNRVDLRRDLRRKGRTLHDDETAIRYLYLHAGREKTLNDFLQREPWTHRVQVEKIGDQIRASLKHPQRGDQTQFYLQKGTAVFLSAGTGGDRVRLENPKSDQRVPRTGETRIPASIYASWKVDGEARRIPLSDYVDRMTMRLSKNEDRIHHHVSYTAKSLLKPARTFDLDRHFSFYTVNRTGEMGRAMLNPMDQTWTRDALRILQKKGLVAFSDPKRASLPETRLTPLGRELALLIQRGKFEPSKRPEKPLTKWSDLNHVEKQILQKMSGQLTEILTAQRVTKSAETLSPEHAIRYLTLRRDKNESYMDFLRRSPDNRLDIVNDGLFVRAEARSGVHIPHLKERSASIHANQAYYWDRESGKVEAIDPRPEIKGRSLHPSAVVAYQVLHGSKGESRPGPMPQELSEFDRYFSFKLETATRHNRTHFRENIEGRVPSTRNFDSFYLDKSFQIKTRKIPPAGIKELEAAFQNLYQKGLVAGKTPDDAKLTSLGRQLVFEQERSERKIFAQEQRHLATMLRQFGILPKNAATQRQSPAYAAFEKTLLTESRTATMADGRQLQFYLPDPSMAEFKNQSRAPETGPRFEEKWLLASTYHELASSLRGKGVTQMEFWDRARLIEKRPELAERPDRLPDGILLYKTPKGQSRAISLVVDGRERQRDQQSSKQASAWASEHGMPTIIASSNWKRAPELAKDHDRVLVLD
ncbi:hypothetical protein SCOR_10095 [Sulfidibacter corallicola]|uniref:Uncharacterized protein n=1 Tax=Sulfidibacter corallicola TaxID=2818388 RepID=A0A8A4TF94_SULCO|nr:hypothetical protein [Sulfidibacter corallicola]QTD48303.1 hypothetical protein J3U87_22215 [Sulfidibacter corallicola]